MDIIIGVPISENKLYSIENFIGNQLKIKQKTPVKTSIVFSTEDSKFADRLNGILINSKLDFNIIVFDLDKEKNDKLTNITLAREAIRQEFLKTDAQYFAFIDSDLLFNENLLNILQNKIKNFDVVYNSYLVHNNKVCNNGLGTCLIRRKVLENIKFRCLIFEQDVSYIDEGLYFELDTLNSGYKILQGAFVTSCHYTNEKDFHRMEPRAKTRWEKTFHSRLIRRTLSFFVNITPIMAGITKISIRLYTK
jgi:hypothetical protein